MAAEHCVCRSSVLTQVEKVQGESGPWGNAAGCLVPAVPMMAGTRAAVSRISIPVRYYLDKHFWGGNLE